MNLELFFKRIGFQGNPSLTLETLTAIQQAFLQAVPFENLDIHKGIKFNLTPESLFEKIVRQHRGGVCFESNGLLHDALTQMGFSVDLLSAEMYPSEKLTGLNTHMALLVHLNDESYLVDVGNGRCFGDPLPIPGPSTSEGEGVTYKILPFNNTHLALFALEKTPEAQWQPRYAFNTTPRTRQDFIEPSHYIETSPDSVFTQSNIVSMLTPEGRITLSQKHDDHKIFWSDAHSEKREISQKEYVLLLADRFKLTPSK
ncbi:arylamine N-acetyltransferase family protein [Endozoicomonas ascidiicola]|uniref:arylamine N-acetyltransferase family protein n=1 Tax=Endozoicomonas ascidiicola TaxID=1698521 RepID=UPI00082B715C|nr:arylamine N-acetyltransferase [Endozoicomonas ascidiicola]